MIEVLKSYSLVEIVTIIVAFALGIKAVVTFWDWAVERIRKIFSKEQEEINEKDAMQVRIQRVNDTMASFSESINNCQTYLEGLTANISDINAKLEHNNQAIDELQKGAKANAKRYDTFNDKISEIHATIKRLKDSDKDAIKAFLTDKHHYYMKQGWIDDYNMSICESRYTHYVAEGGNSFIGGFMEDLRKLPSMPPQEDK